MFISQGTQVREQIFRGQCTGLPDFLSRRLEILDLRDSDLWAMLEKTQRRNLDLSLLNLIIIVLRD